MGVSADNPVTGHRCSIGLTARGLRAGSESPTMRFVPFKRAAARAEPAQGVRLSAWARAERVLLNLLIFMLISYQVALPLVGIMTSAGGPAHVVGSLTVLVALVYAGWLYRVRASPSPTPGDSRWDLVAVWALLLGGLATEILMGSDTVVSGMANTAFLTINGATYCGNVRLRLPLALGPLTVAMASHIVMLHRLPVVGIGGALNILAVGVACRLLARTIRSGADQDDRVYFKIRAAERAEALARVHDALGLLNVISRSNPSADLDMAVRATSARTDSWVSGASPAFPALGQSILAVAQQFPDLDVRVDVTEIAQRAVRMEVCEATATALHTLLTNVRLHADAQHVLILVSVAGDCWTLTVADDGRGFGSNQLKQQGGLNKIARAALTSVGCDLAVTSTAGVGTVATITGTFGAAESPQPRPHLSTRFSTWLDRPTDEVAKVRLIVDIAQASLLALLIVFSVVGGRYLAAHTPADMPTTLLVVVGVACASLFWLLGPVPSQLVSFVLTTAAVCIGAALTWAEGPAAVDGDKFGILLMTCPVLMVVLARPASRFLSLTSSALQLLILGRIDIVSGIFAAALIAVSVVVAALIAATLLRFAHEVVADKNRIIELERTSAGRILRRQVWAMRVPEGIGSAQASDALDEEAAERRRMIKAEANSFLRAEPLVQGAESIAEASTEPGDDSRLVVLSVLARLKDLNGGQMMSVQSTRGPSGWQVSILVPKTDTATVERQLAGLLRSAPGQRHRVSVRAAGSSSVTTIRGTGAPPAVRGDITIDAGRPL